MRTLLPLLVISMLFSPDVHATFVICEKVANGEQNQTKAHETAALMNRSIMMAGKLGYTEVFSPSMNGEVFCAVVSKPKVVCK